MLAGAGPGDAHTEVTFTPADRLRRSVVLPWRVLPTAADQVHAAGEFEQLFDSGH